MNRVKSLSKSGNAKKDPLPAVNKESSSTPSTQVFADVDDMMQYAEPREVEASRRAVERDNISYNPSSEYDKDSSGLLTSYNNNNGRDVNEVASGSNDRDKLEMKSSYGGSTSTSQKTYSYAQNSTDGEEDVQKISPPRRKISSRDEGTEKLGNWLKKEGGGPDRSTMAHKSQGANNAHANANNAPPPRHYEPESSVNDGNIDEILEVGFP